MNSPQKMAELFKAPPEQLPLFIQLNEAIERSVEDPQLQKSMRAAVSALVLALQKNPKKLRILLCSYNAPDGIGDAINLIGFTRMLQSLFAGIAQVEIRGVVFINAEKLRKLKEVLVDDEAADIGFCDLDHPVENNSTITIFSKRLDHLPQDRQIAPVFSELLAASPELKQFHESSDFYCNIATPFLQANFPFHMVKSKRLVYSILEISGVLGPTPFQLQNPLLKYSEVSMGCAQGEVGYKFDPQLLRFSRHAKQSCFDEIIAALNANQRLNDLLFPRGLFDGDQLKYFSNRNRLCIGYLQSKAATQIAAQLFMRTGDPKKNVMLICELSAVEELLAQTDLKDSFSQINFHGKTTTLRALNNNAERELTVIDFRNISEKTKFALYVLADMVLGSGDNSRTDTMLCRLPFWQVPPWKMREVGRLLEDIQFDYPMLYRYFNLQFQASVYDYILYEPKQLHELIHLVQKYESDLVKEWSQFQAEVLSHHNVEHYVQYLMLNFLSRAIPLEKSSTATLQTLCTTITDMDYPVSKFIKLKPLNSTYEAMRMRFGAIHKACAFALEHNQWSAIKNLYLKYPYFSVKNSWLEHVVPLLANPMVKANAAQFIESLLNLKQDETAVILRLCEDFENVRVKSPIRHQPSL